MIEFDMTGVTLFGFTVRWYGVMIALGVLFGVLIAGKREKRLSLPPDTALNITLIGVPSAIIAARLYYVIFSWEEYAGNPAAIFNIRQGGIAIYGAIIGALISTYIFSRIKRLPFRSLLDLGGPSLAMGQALGRWGNFFNQEAYGELVENASLQVFPYAVHIDALGEWHMATFFYESAWCFLIVIALLLLEKKDFFKKSGDVFFWYGFLYALERGIVEGFRTDSLYWGTVRVSQALSFLIALTVILVFLLRTRKFGRGATALVTAAGGAALALMGHSLSAIALSLLSIAATGWLYRGMCPKEE